MQLVKYHAIKFANFCDTNLVATLTLLFGFTVVAATMLSLVSDGHRALVLIFSLPFGFLFWLIFLALFSGHEVPRRLSDMPIEVIRLDALIHEASALLRWEILFCEETGLKPVGFVSNIEQSLNNQRRALREEQLTWIEPSIIQYNALCKQLKQPSRHNYVTLNPYDVKSKIAWESDKGAIQVIYG